MAQRENKSLNDFTKLHINALNLNQVQGGNTSETNVFIVIEDVIIT